PGGSPIGEPTRFVIGVVANQGAVDEGRELERFMWKVDAGAEFVVTQPVFDPARLRAFLERTAEWPVPVIAGLWPLTSLRNAEFLANEVPGVHVPERVLRRMELAQAESREAAEAEGVRIALEAYREVADIVAGVHITAPGGDVSRALAVLEGVDALG
ncbi:MAG: bifunctional homocysteine S-methyltransferase/methylenetetrahydrofolate reductase, partial [Gemmatimonadetes bacterium]